MAKQQPPAFQLYAQDLLAGTADMTVAQFGAYVRLLCHQWIRNGLQNDDEVLSRLSGAGIDVLTVVRGKFRMRKNGRLYNMRLEIERKKQRERGKQQALNANKRWGNNGDAMASIRHGSGICQTHALQSSSSSSVNTNTPLPPAFPKELDGEDFAKAWERWKQHRKEIKHKLTDSTAAAQLKKLAAMGSGRAVAAIDHSISGGWQGIFENKDSAPKSIPTAAPHRGFSFEADKNKPMPKTEVFR